MGVASGTVVEVSAERSTILAASELPASAMTAVRPSGVTATAPGESPTANVVTAAGPGTTGRPVRSTMDRVPPVFMVTSALVPSGVTVMPNAPFSTFVPPARSAGARPVRST